MVDRRLLEEEGWETSIEMFNPSEEDVLLWKNSRAALVHPVEVEENSDNQNHKKDEVACLVLCLKLLGSSMRRLY